MVVIRGRWESEGVHSWGGKFRLGCGIYLSILRTVPPSWNFWPHRMAGRRATAVDMPQFVLCLLLPAMAPSCSISLRAWTASPCNASKWPPPLPVPNKNGSQPDVKFLFKSAAKDPAENPPAPSGLDAVSEDNFFTCRCCDSCTYLFNVLLYSNTLCSESLALLLQGNFEPCPPLARC